MILEDSSPFFAQKIVKCPLLYWGTSKILFENSLIAHGNSTDYRYALRRLEFSKIAIDYCLAKLYYI